MYKNIPEQLRPKSTFAGQLDPAFLYADKVYRHADILKGLKCFKGLAISEADRHRLVEASKSPTADKTEEKLKVAAWNARSKDLQQAHKYNRAHTEATGECMPPEFVELEPFNRQSTPLNKVGCKAVIEYREWADEYRVRTEVEATTGNAPPEQTERVSAMLSTRGARKIAESCEYMAMKKGGYKTFVTGTFDDETRERIASEETTIQKEVSRTMDALQKLYQRGFIDKNDERVEQHENQKLPYCWVVEIPKNEAGEDNPHVHMLLGWGVEYKHFEPWAKRIEGIWGNGYFHLEKIKDSNCAGSYMAKAAGYLSKAQGSDDQGTVTGNRYGISSEARAPSWVKVSESQLHIMGQLIADIYDHLTVKHGPKYRERKKLNDQLAKTPKDNKAARLAIGAKLQTVREEIKAIPVRCNKYQVILKGKLAASRFFSWARTPDTVPAVDWLPEKPEGEYWREGERFAAGQSQYFRAVQRKFHKMKQRRHAVTDDVCGYIVDQINEFKDWAFSGWGEYEAMQA
ncbi:MAG: rolling circle replication-associated protein [Cellvibrionaceae bacterium]